MLLFHGTSRDFEAFSAAEMAIITDRHPNCNLGLWLSTSVHLAARFGAWTLAVEVPSERPYHMPSEDLFKLARDGDRDADGGVLRHRDMAAKLRRDGHDIILVVENDGSHPTVVALDPEAVQVVRRVHSSDREAIGELVELDAQSRAAEGRDLSSLEQSFAL